MKTMGRLTALLLAVGTLSGCSIAGTWKVTQVTPGEAAENFDFQRITFDNEGMYTATKAGGSDETTSTGTYKWTGGLLKLDPNEGDAKTYRSYERIDGKLCVTQHIDDQPITAVLTKQP